MSDQGGLQQKRNLESCIRTSATPTQTTNEEITMLYRRTGEPLRIGKGARFAFFPSTCTYFIFDAQGFAASCDGNEVTEFKARGFNDFFCLVNLAASAPRRKCRIIRLQDTNLMIFYKLIATATQGARPRRSNHSKKKR